MRGIISIILGAVMVVGGLSGKLVLMGTHSGGALAAVGCFVIVRGLLRLKANA